MEHWNKLEQGTLGNTKTKMPEKKSRKWCLTLNNYSEEELEQWNSYFSEKKNCLKYIIGKEKGETNGTPHLQMWARFTNPISFNSLKKISNRVHLEECKGNDISNIKYCSKEGNIYGSKNIEINEDKKSNLIAWQYHLKRHNKRGSTFGLLEVLRTLEIMETHEIENDMIKQYEEYTDLRDEMLECDYCKKEKTEQLEQESKL